MYNFEYLALNCPRCIQGQIMCADCPDCPECDLTFLHLEQLDLHYSAAVLAQNTVNQLPSEERVRIMTELFGAFGFKHLNHKKFRGREGIDFTYKT